MQNDKVWRVCSTCKKNILQKTKYFECSVSTCTGKRTGYVFCSVICWEAHLPEARHKNAYALEETAPAETAPAETARAPAASPAKPTISRPAFQSADSQRRVIVSSPTSAAPKTSPIPRETLVVASKLKDYVRARSDMNTSAGVFDALSDIIRELCDEAIDKARQDGRKTLMDRDF